jgi:outer membrane protein OmpA-like peptidoglycan-associated protein
LPSSPSRAVVEVASPVADESRRNGHRAAILTRRAAYLTAALAAMGCPSQGPTEPGGTTATGTNRDKEEPPPENPPPLATSWEEVMKQAPPRDVPAEISARERTWLEGAMRSIDAEYEALRAVWVAAPDCDPTAAECKAWKELGDKAAQVYRLTEHVPISPCPGANGKTASVLERQRAHQRYIASLIARVEQHLDGLASRYGKGGGEEWGRLLTEAKKPPPRPCLSPCRMPEVDDVLVSVGFAKGDAALRLDEPAVKQSLDGALAKQRQNGKRAQLVVRGHADASEPDADALAAKRAAAVAAWLVAAGIPKDDVAEKSLGSRYAVELGGSDANRRVDFEVIVR